MEGTVKSYFEDRGFGFIAIKGFKDVFYHASEVVGDRLPSPGDVVRFDVEPGTKGSHAVGIKLVAK
jgi:CspA family cold shock protein